CPACSYNPLRAFRLYRPLRGRDSVHRIRARSPRASQDAQRRARREVHVGTPSGPADLLGIVRIDWRRAAERARLEAEKPRGKRSADRPPRLPAEARETQRIELGDPNVFGARSLGTLALIERHGLTFTQVVEPGAGAGRVV